MKLKDLKELAVKLMTEPKTKEAPVGYSISNTMGKGIEHRVICPYCKKISHVPASCYDTHKCTCGKEFHFFEYDYEESTRGYTYPVDDVLFGDNYAIFSESYIEVEYSLPEIEKGTPADEALSYLLTNAKKTIKPPSENDGVVFILSKEFGKRRIKIDATGKIRVSSWLGWVSSDIRWEDPNKVSEFIKNGPFAESLKKCTANISLRDLISRIGRELSNSTPAKKPSSAKVSAAKYLQAENKDVKDIIASNASLPYAFLTSVTEKNNYVFFCCGKKHQMSANAGEAVRCPICGHKKNPTDSFNRDYCSEDYVDMFVTDEGEVVLNRYEVEFKLSKDLPLPKLSEFTRTGITVFTPKGILNYYSKYSRLDDGKYGHTDIDETLTSGYSVGRISFYRSTIFNSLRGENVVELLKSSVFKNFALEEYMEHNSIDNNTESNVDLSNLLWHITTVIKYPITEHLAKQGLWDLYATVASANKNEVSDICKPRAKSVREAFNLSKGQAKIVSREKLSYPKLNAFKRITSLDSTAEWEDINWVFSNYHVNTNGDNEILRCMEASQLRLKDVKSYILSTFYNQAIKLGTSPILWYDYIKMMDKLGFSQKQKKKELKPSSLEKAHDVLCFAARNIFDKEKAKIFDKNIEEAQRFEYSFEEYFIKAPESAEDLVKEGIALNHSVAQHIEYVADQKEYILFIRSKDAPEDSLYTVELMTNKSIVQVRGVSNTLPKEERVLNFIQKWAKFKKLEIVSF